MWCIANKDRTKFIAHDDFGFAHITSTYVLSTAYDSMDEAISDANDFAKTHEMSPLSPKHDDMLYCQLR